MPEAFGIIAGIAVMYLLFEPLFGDMDGFLDCVKPDIISLLRGEEVEDWRAGMKLLFWFFCGFVIYFAVYTALS